MYCLECARRGTHGAELAGDDPMTVLRELKRLGDTGDLGARRLYFGILWDEGRSILCYRCKHGRPVRLTADQALTLEREAEKAPTVAPTTPSSAVGEMGASEEKRAA
jgi:hypothetical protein